MQSIEFLFERMKILLEMDSGEGCRKTVNVLNVNELYTQNG
jgi:hypothetical protein